MGPCPWQKSLIFLSTLFSRIHLSMPGWLFLKAKFLLCRSSAQRVLMTPHCLNWFLGLLSQGLQQSLLTFCAYLPLLFTSFCKYVLNISPLLYFCSVFLLSRFLLLFFNKCLLKSLHPLIPFKYSLNPFFQEAFSAHTNLTRFSLWKFHSTLFISLILSYSFCSISCHPIKAALPTIIHSTKGQV